MTAPAVEIQESSEPPSGRAPEGKDKKVTIRVRRKTKGRFLSLLGGFALLAALLFPFYVVQTPGRGIADFTFWNTLALGACILGALGAFTLTVNPWRASPVFPLLALPALGLATAAILGFGTSRAYAVGPGIGAWLALTGALVSLLAGIRGMPVLWRD